MTTTSGIQEQASSLRWARRAAAAACGWALLFAALSFFWAAGGRTGLQPLEQPPASSRAVWLVADLAAGILKIGGRLLALAPVRTAEHRPSPRTMPAPPPRCGGWLPPVAAALGPRGKSLANRGARPLASAIAGHPMSPDSPGSRAYHTTTVYCDRV